MNMHDRCVKHAHLAVHAATRIDYARRGADPTKDRSIALREIAIATHLLSRLAARRKYGPSYIHARNAVILSLVWYVEPALAKSAAQTVTT